MERFVAVQEPTCTWAVFDTLEDVPAQMGGMVLVGLDEAEALELAALANRQCALRQGRALASGHLRVVSGSLA